MRAALATVLRFAMAAVSSVGSAATWSSRSWARSLAAQRVDGVRAPDADQREGRGLPHDVLGVAEPRDEVRYGLVSVEGAERLARDDPLGGDRRAQERDGAGYGSPEPSAPAGRHEVPGG
ncbi:hypothetical protein GCM10010488_12790 [Oerskovia jenensis]